MTHPDGFFITSRKRERIWKRQKGLYCDKQRDKTQRKEGGSEKLKYGKVAQGTITYRNLPHHEIRPDAEASREACTASGGTICERPIYSRVLEEEPIFVGLAVFDDETDKLVKDGFWCFDIWV